MKPNRFNKEPLASEKVEIYNNAECGVTDRAYNPIDQMEKEIAIHKREIQELKFELLECYRRLNN